MYFDDPPCDDGIFAPPDAINPRAIINACDDFLYGADHIGDFKEKHVLSMIRAVYGIGIVNSKFFLPKGEIAEKQLEDAKVSLQRKVKKGGLGRKGNRIVQFLSIIESQKFEEHKGIISEFLSMVDGEV